MISKIIAALLMLFALTTVSANLASAQGSFKRDGYNGRGGGSVHGRSFHGHNSHRRGFGVYGLVDGYGYDNSGSADWYGISSGYDPCPLFRQRVMTPDGWRVRMIPVC